MVKKYSAKRGGFFKLTWGILLLTVVIYALNIMLILKLVPVFEQNDLLSEAVNLIIAPANFLFEDLTGISSAGFNFTLLPSSPPFSYRLGFIDLLTWTGQFFYAYLLACLMRRMMRTKIRW